MKPIPTASNPPRRSTHRLAIYGATALLTLGTFLADIRFSLGELVCGLYILPVLLLHSVVDSRVLFAFAAVCSVLTFFGIDYSVDRVTLNHELSHQAIGTGILWIVAAALDRMRKADARLREMEERYALAFRGSNDGLFDIAPSTDRAYFSPDFKAALGFEDREIQTTDEVFWSRLHPEDLGRVRSVYQYCLHSSEALDTEFRLRHRGGEYRWFRSRGKAICDETGKPVRLVGAMNDITDRKQAEIDRQRALQQLASAQEDERRRIALELHDQTGQQLTALQVGMKALEMFPQATGEIRRRLGHLRALANQLQEGVHRLACDLRPSELDNLGIETALRTLVEEWSEQSQIVAELTCTGHDGDRLSEVFQTTLFRVAQEALTNVQKHANAKRVGILLELSEDRVQLIVEDDGQGFLPDLSSSSAGDLRRLGLMGMRERLSLAGGSMVIESAPGLGTTLYARIPLPQLATSA